MTNMQALNWLLKHGGNDRLHNAVVRWIQNPEGLSFGDHVKKHEIEK